MPKSCALILLDIRNSSTNRGRRLFTGSSNLMFAGFSVKKHKTVLKNQVVFSYSWVARISCLRLPARVGAQADALAHRQV